MRACVQIRLWSNIIFYYVKLNNCSTFQIHSQLKQKLGNVFRGVYSLDRLPDFLQPGAYVVNSHTSNLPGEHWIAIDVRPNIIRVFDPLGMYYPPALVTKLERMITPVEYNDIMYQNPLTMLCGNYCIEWLVSQYCMCN